MTLHIYSQEFWHDDAYIAGTRTDLEVLHGTIGRAIREGHGQMESFVCDGEGYSVHVVAVTDEQAAELPVPYTDEIARAQQGGMRLGLWDLIKRKAAEPQQKKTITKAEFDGAAANLIGAEHHKYLTLSGFNRADFILEITRGAFVGALKPDRSDHADTDLAVIRATATSLWLGDGTLGLAD